jgi:hypothetical protein
LVAFWRCVRQFWRCSVMFWVLLMFSWCFCDVFVVFRWCFWWYWRNGISWAKMAHMSISNWHQRRCDALLLGLYDG